MEGRAEEEPVAHVVDRGHDVVLVPAASARGERPDVLQEIGKQGAWRVSAKKGIGRPGANTTYLVVSAMGHEMDRVTEDLLRACDQTTGVPVPQVLVESLAGNTGGGSCSVTVD